MLYRDYIGVIFPHSMPGASMEVKPPKSFLPEKVLVRNYTGLHVHYHTGSAELYILRVLAQIYTYQCTFLLSLSRCFVYQCLSTYRWSLN